MKNSISRLLVAISMGFIVFQSEAQQTSFTYGIDRSTGNFIATDVWNNHEYDEMQKDSGRQLDEQSGRLLEESGRWHIRKSFILANTFELETNGTNLKASMLIGFYASSVYDNPDSFISHFWVEIFDATHFLGKVYYGNYYGFPNHNEDSMPISRLNIQPLSHEKTKAGEVLWIIKVSYSVELQRPVDFMPKVDIDYQMGGETMRCGFYGSQYKTTVSDLKRQMQKKFVVTTSLLKTDEPNTLTARIGNFFSKKTSATLPEINVSITKRDGFLLITFSPVVANASLEQANINSYPWAWQPAITMTNVVTNGWYVVPTMEPRVFRVRIDP